MRDPQDKNKFAVIMNDMGETFERKISPGLMKTYFSVLINYSIDEVEKAFISHLLDPDQGMFFPKPANIVKQLSGTSKQQEQAVEGRAEIAWNVILGEMSRIGSYGSLKLDDRQALASVTAVGGWKKICSQTHDQLVWVKKEFISCYENYERTPLEALPMNLPGRIELDKHKSEQSQGMKSLAAGLNEFNLKNKGNNNG
jgi:hypothetical protein